MTDAERARHRALCEAGGASHSEMTDAERARHRALCEAGGACHSEMTDAERAQHRALCVARGGTPLAQTNANDVDKQVADAVLAYLSDVLGAPPTSRIFGRCKARSTVQNTIARATLYATILRLYDMGAREVPLSSAALIWLASHFAISVPAATRRNMQAWRALIFNAFLQRARAHAAFSRD
eukprot:COSAG03_NODE_1930_length_3344_cov_1.757165_4_plen_182_part_00